MKKAFFFALILVVSFIPKSYAQETKLVEKLLNAYDTPILSTSLTNQNPPIPLSAFGDVRTIELSPVFQGSFEYTVSNTDLIINTATNSGTVTQSQAMAVISTGTTTGSIAILKSKQHAKYRAGLGGLTRFTALFTGCTAGTEQYIGLAGEVGSNTTFNNGYMLGCNGDTFSIVRFQNDTLADNISIFDDPLDGSGSSGMILDETKLNVFGIRFQYLGAGAIEYLIEDDKTGRLFAFHTIDYTNQNTIPSVFNPNFNFTICSSNKATTSDIVMKSSSYSYFTEGKTSLTELQSGHQTSGVIEKTSVTTEVAIFTIRNKTTYAGKVNFIDILLERTAGAIEASSANNLGNISFIFNATLGGVPSYSDINTTNSVIEIDTSGTTVTGGSRLFGGLLAGKNDSAAGDLTQLEILLVPGDTLTVSGTSANSATFDASILWKELF
jgi:hypothetical protein